MTPQRLDPSDLRPGEREHELAAIVALLRAGVMPAYRLAAVIEQLGSAVALVQLPEAHPLFAQLAASHEILDAVTPEDLGRAVRDVAEWLARGLDVRTVFDADYPANLRTIFDRPPFVFVAGCWIEERDSHSVAVVGTRQAAHEGLQRAARLSRQLVEAGFTVISGLALGIDTAAHIAALKAQGRTVAVMGTGLDHRYPKRNALLAEQILAAGGALVSQFFPQQQPRQWTFPMRNVVMSGLALATAVIEAGSTSGARRQARIALQHGRTVFLHKSLVASHEWAKKYVTDGAYGTRAVEISSTEEVVDRLQGRGVAEAPLAV
jgi:DNA processing protein